MKFRREISLRTLVIVARVFDIDLKMSRGDILLEIQF